jgi:hypothetical protein
MYLFKYVIASVEGMAAIWKECISMFIYIYRHMSILIYVGTYICLYTYVNTCIYMYIYVLVCICYSWWGRNGCYLEGMYMYMWVYKYRYIWIDEYIDMSV